MGITSLRHYCCVAVSRTIIYACRWLQTNPATTLYVLRIKYATHATHLNTNTQFQLQGSCRPANAGFLCLLRLSLPTTMKPVLLTYLSLSCVCDRSLTCGFTSDRTWLELELGGSYIQETSFMKSVACNTFHRNNFLQTNAGGTIVVQSPSRHHRGGIFCSCDGDHVGEEEKTIFGCITLTLWISCTRKYI
jgi:hypothetical protein